MTSFPLKSWKPLPRRVALFYMHAAWYFDVQIFMCHHVFIYEYLHKICLHVTFLARVCYYYYCHQNNGQNGSVTHSVLFTPSPLVQG